MNYLSAMCIPSVGFTDLFFRELTNDVWTGSFRSRIRYRNYIFQCCSNKYNEDTRNV